MRNFGILDDEKFLIGFFFFRFCNLMKSCVDAARNAETFLEQNLHSPHTRSRFAQFCSSEQTEWIIHFTWCSFDSYNQFITRLKLTKISGKQRTWARDTTCKWSAASGKTDFSSQTSFTARLETVMMTLPTRANCFWLRNGTFCNQTWWSYQRYSRCMRQRRLQKVVDCDSAQRLLIMRHFHDQGPTAIFFSTNGH